MKKRKKLVLIVSGILTFIVVTFVTVMLGSRYWIKVNEIELCYDDLPDQLVGYKILQISDLHSNNNRKMNVDIWSEIDKLDFDIAVVTGDVVRRDFEHIESHSDGFKKLAERKKVFFVDGNHEKFCYDEIKEWMTQRGVIVLDNETYSLDENAAELRIIGLRDYLKLSKIGFDKADELLTKSDEFTVLLAHQPQICNKLENIENTDLVLSGHTHGGQIRIPFLPTLYAPGQGFFPEYGDGLYEIGKTKLYVSKGIGTTVFPVRLFNRPELAVFELIK